jgi:hypothetical protein
MPSRDLTPGQIKYAELVAGGMDERDAVTGAGYDPNYIKQNLNRLKFNPRIQELIEELQTVRNTDIADEEEIMMFWTNNMRNPTLSFAQRTENSRLLGKSKQMFVQRQEIDAKVKQEPVMLVPAITPQQWEEYWEETDGKTNPA